MSLPRTRYSFIILLLHRRIICAPAVCYRHLPTAGCRRHSGFVLNKVIKNNKAIIYIGEKKINKRTTRNQFSSRPGSSQPLDRSI